MSVQNDGTSPPVQDTTQTSDTSGTTQAGGSSGSTKPHAYKTLDELFKHEPEFHKVVMMGMAQKMCQDMKSADDRLKKIQKGQG